MRTRGLQGHKRRRSAGIAQRLGRSRVPDGISAGIPCSADSLLDGNVSPTGPALVIQLRRGVRRVSRTAQAVEPGHPVLVDGLAASPQARLPSSESRPGWTGAGPTAQDLVPGDDSGVAQVECGNVLSESPLHEPSVCSGDNPQASREPARRAPVGLPRSRRSCPEPATPPASPIATRPASCRRCRRCGRASR